MSRILQALEKAHNDGRSQDSGAGQRIFALPSMNRSISLRESALRKAGWVSALPHPPKGSHSYAALADHLRGKVEAPACILVCGVGQRAGATAASLNLSTELALTGKSTALWCELPTRSARVRRLLGPSCQHGLADHLFRETPLREVFLRTQVPQLVLLPGSGWRTPLSRTPSLEDLERFFAEVRDRYPDRYVLVDGPSPIDSPLTAGLAKRFEATVLVVPAGTPETKVHEAKEAIGEVPVCAVLLNRVPRWFVR